MITMSAASELRTAIRVLESFREVDSQITLPSMLTFLYFAAEDGQSQNQASVEARLDMSGATTSRATAYWLKYKKARVAGENMLESNVDPADRRYRIVSLNHKGLQFLRKIIDAVSKGSSHDTAKKA